MLDTNNFTGKIPMCSSLCDMVHLPLKRQNQIPHQILLLIMFCQVCWNKWTNMFILLRLSVERWLWGEQCQHHMELSPKYGPAKWSQFIIISIANWYIEHPVTGLTSLNDYFYLQINVSNCCSNQNYLQQLYYEHYLYISNTVVFKVAIVDLLE